MLLMSGVKHVLIVRVRSATAAAAIAAWTAHRGRRRLCGNGAAGLSAIRVGEGMMAELAVMIAGRVCRVACDEGEEVRLGDLAQLVDALLGLAMMGFFVSMLTSSSLLAGTSLAVGAVIIIGWLWPRSLPHRTESTAHV